MRSFKLVAATLILLSAAAQARAQGSVDDATVKKWIMAGITQSQNYAGAPDIDTQLAANYPVDTVRIGWISLRDCRRAGNSLDLNLAAAEHYSFMRFISSYKGDTSFRDLPSWYGSLKTWANATAMLQYLATSNQPVSPPDPNVTRWGQNGVEAGLLDYQARTGDAPADQSGALIAAIGVAYALYSQYASTGSPSCSVSIQ